MQTLGKGHKDIRNARHLFGCGHYGYYSFTSFNTLGFIHCKQALKNYCSIVDKSQIYCTAFFRANEKEKKFTPAIECTVHKYGTLKTVYIVNTKNANKYCE